MKRFKGGNEMATELMEQKMTYMVAGEKVELTPNIVRQYLVSGNPESVTMQEIVMFMNLCKFNGLNPWLKEAYCIKYGSSPATMVVGKEAYLKRAEANPAYDGSEAGIIVFAKDGTVENRVGTFHLKDEEVVGGWARVWRKDRSHPVTVEVPFDEYAGRTKDGQLNSQWRTKPATMIRKVALVNALREAFPGDIGGMYTEEEAQQEQPQDIVVQSQVIKDNLPEQPVQKPKTARKAAPKPQPKPVPQPEEVEDTDVEEMPFA
jgi:phage recombination protein Bet